MAIFALLTPLFYSFKPEPGTDLFEISKNLSIFSSVYKEIDLNYVEEVEPGKFMKTGIDAMLKSLDPYTNYIPESRIEDYRLMTTGEYGGIGSLIRKDDEYVIISEPYEGYPAQRAGLQAGDKIVEVDGHDVKGKNTKEISALLKGQSGTKLEMKYERDGEITSVELVREKVKLADVPYSGMIDSDNNIGYVKLNSFTTTASMNVGKSIQELKDQGMEKLVFDLRGNGGGLLNEAVSIVNFFIPKNTIVVETKGRVPEVNRTYRTQVQPMDDKMPVVVLVDGNSASASEIVTGAIQDWDRGIVVGRRSFGKGLVQKPVELPDGSMVRLTTSRYYTPTGRSIQKPYEDGSEAYRKEKYERFKNGEVYHADSIDFPDSLKFETMSTGRAVYGGGGIMPDFYVPVDTSETSDYFSNLIRKGIMNSFILEYVDKNRKKLKEKYPTFADFKKGFDGSSLTKDLIEAAKKEKLEFNKEEFNTSKHIIEVRIKAMVAQNIWDYTKFYEIINELNNSYKKALEILDDGSYEKVNLAAN